MEYNYHDPVSGVYIKATYLYTSNSGSKNKLLQRDYYEFKIFHNGTLIWQQDEYSPSPMTGFQDPQSFGEILSYMDHYYYEGELPPIAMKWMETHKNSMAVLACILEGGEEG